MTTMLTIRQVAEILGVHVNTVHRLPESDLPYYRIVARGDRRYRREDVEAYLEERRVGWTEAELREAFGR
jgi:excisionase family DNA binding protein